MCYSVHELKLGPRGTSDGPVPTVPNTGVQVSGVKALKALV